MAQRALDEQAEQGKKQHVAKQVAEAGVQEHCTEHATEVEIGEMNHPAFGER